MDWFNRIVSYILQNDIPFVSDFVDSIVVQVKSFNSLLPFDLIFYSVTSFSIVLLLKIVRTVK